MTTSRAAILLIIFSATLCLGLILAAFLGWPPLGIPGEWVWQRRQKPSFPLLYDLPLILAYFSIFLAVVCGLSSRWESGRHTEQRGKSKLAQYLGVGALVIASFLMQLGVRDVGAGAAEDMLVVGMPSAGGFARQARVVEVMGMRSFLANYDQFIDDFREPIGSQLRVGHVNTHPPGNILYFWCLTSALDRFPGLRWPLAKLAPSASSEVGEIISPTWKDPLCFVGQPPGLDAVLVSRKADDSLETETAYCTVSKELTRPLSDVEITGLWAGSLKLRWTGALVVLLTYLLGYKLFGRKEAFWAAALVAVCPGLLLFNPSFDVLYALLGVLIFWLVYSAAHDRSLVVGVLAGFALYFGLFFTLAMVIPAALAALVIVIKWTREKELGRQLAHRRLWAVVALALAGFFVPLVVLQLAAGYNSLAVWRVCLQSNALFNEASGRSAWKWTLYNPLDFLMFLGVSTALLCVWGLGSGMAKLGSWQRLKQVGALPLSLLACLVLLNFSGKNLGEAGRLWLFLTPLTTLACVGMLNRLGSRTRKVLMILVGLQMLQTIVFRITLNLMLMI